MNNIQENVREKKTNIVALYPLSPMQGGFFFQALYAEDSDAYFIQMLLELTGELQVGALKQAWLILLDRHESLRASFMWEDLEEPIQIIHKKVELTWHEEDWQVLSEEAQIQKMDVYIEKDRAQGFDFTQPPLMRWSLFKCNPRKHYLLWSQHHILSDGWSGPIILDEIRSIYDSLVNGKPINLPNRRAYGDYIAWLSRQDQKSAENYWKQLLAGAIPTKLINKKIKEEKAQAYGDNTLNFSLETTQQLLSYAGKLGVTPNTVLQTLWGIVLSMYTGQSDVIFGVTVSGRQIDLAGIESMVGMFINTLPLRVQLSGSESVEDIFQNIQSQMVGMQEYAHVPLWKIQAQQKEGGTGLFDSTYTYQNYPIQEDVGQSSGLGINLKKGIEKMEYTLGITLSYQNGLSARIDYREACFTQDFIEQLLIHFEQLIINVIHKPWQKVGELSFLCPDELKQMALWNATQHEYPKDSSIVQMFEAQVERTPLNIAIAYEDQQITYQELNERSNQLAHYLQDFGVEAEVPVAIAIERSIEMVIAILGILKAGGAYVPVDINYPPERLEYMLEDSGVPFIVSRRAELEKLSVGQRIVIDLDEIQKSLIAQPKTPLPHRLYPENLAYIIYTSGSTGRPKGVGVSHGSAGAYLSWAKTIYGVNDSQPILFHGSICFDMSITSLFVPLLTGKLIQIIKEDFAKMLEGGDLKDAFGFIKLTPSHLKLVEESTHYKLSDLSHCFVVGGEALTAEHLTNRNLTVFNEYGPTEATVACSLYEINQTQQYQTIPIGRPIWNTQMHIFNKHLNLVPVGVAGEIYIGGVGIARGYINKPSLTAERFIPNPFGNGDRLYQTGDLGRYLPDGNMEYLGRIDHQVKIRGYRIELGEIEATLEASTAVQQAIVLCREDSPGQTRLVAYVVPKNTEDSGLVESLKSLCQNRLPDYMQPTLWVILESWPLTANGKIDRKGLPAPEGREGLGECQTPQGLIEERLAQIWSELLGLEVGRTDHFFRLGGHSLLAAQVVSRLREVLRLEVPLKAIFEYSVLSELARYLEQSQLEEGILPAIPNVSRDKPQALSFAQQRLWFLEQLLPNTGLYHNPLSLRLLGALNVGALRQALDAIVARHEILRTIIINSEGIALQKVLPEDIRFALTESTEEDTEAFIKAPFQFDSEPLCRGLLLRRSEQEHILLLVFHHIVVDDWSMGIFWKELNDFYTAYSENKLFSLPPLPVQYLDYSVWQRSWLKGEVLEKQLDYWQVQLKEVSRLELPMDYPRPKELSYQGGSVGRKLSKELLAQLKAFSQSQGVTLFMSLVASIQGFLSRYCNQTDIVMGTPIANRRASEIEGLIGFFINTLVLRNQFEDNPSFETLIKRVESNTLSAYEHQDVPFEQLVEHLQVSRELNRNPLFQVMFNLQHDEGKFRLGDLEIFPEVMPEYLSRFDLLINVTAGAEGFYLRLDYAKELFSQERIERLAEYYETFLSALLNAPSKRLSEMPLLGEQERQQLFLWNETQQDLPKNKSVPQLFEEQVEKTPFNIAVRYEGQELSYQALNEQANQLAHYLRQKGVGPDKLVAIAIERSLEMIVGILGTLKASGAYVPLDASYPEDRLAFMLEDTQASVLITQASLKEKFAYYGGNIIVLDENEEQLKVQQESKLNPPSLTFPHHLAYVIYTSGSTGRPKGVMVKHVSLLNFLENFHYSSEQEENTALWTNTSFDVSIYEIWTSLRSGGCLCIPTETIRRDPLLYFNYLVKYKITSTYLPPYMLTEFLDFIRTYPSKLNVKRLLVGVEPIAKNILLELQQKIPNLKIVNGYGPTEATICATLYWIKEKNNHDSLISPIGKQISNTQIYILDPHLNTVPIGVSGEIYIGGAGLARGYLNKPGLTAEQFVPNPFGTGSCLYKTGDLGRYLPDGNIEFVGRVDYQVKLRGFRIELEEIERTLELSEAVQQLVVLCREDIPGQKRLVAYVIPKKKGDSNGLIGSLQSFCQSRLPDYMQPNQWLILESLPITPNGKIDRKGLPVPEATEGQRRYEAPEGLIEERLAQIWSELLGIEKIGRFDNFFQIGGDSIVSIQLVSRARKRGMLFEVKQIFETPILSDLALHTQEERINLVPQESAKGKVSLTPIQHWFFAQSPAIPHYYNQAMWLKSEAVVDLQRLQDALETIYQHHDGFHLRYRKGNQGWEQYYADGSPLPWKICQSFAEENLGEICTELQSSLNIEQGPLSQLLWFAEKGQLLWVIHHLIVDGVSWRILLEDLNLAYAGKTLGPKSHSYRAWSESLARYVANDEISYYQKQLENVPRLPSDYTYSGYITLRNVQGLDIRFSEQTTKQFLQNAHQSYGTQPDDLLLLALVQAVGDCFGKYELCVDLEGHGREDLGEGLDLTHTLGWFTSIHPVVLSLPKPSDLDQSIKHIKEHLRQIPQKGVCYGIMSQIQKTCPFVRGDVVFNYLGQWSNVKRNEETFFFGEGETGLSASLDNPHPHPLAINGGVNQGRLGFHWSYSTCHYKKETIERFSSIFTERLEALIEYCSEGKHCGYSPSDFPLCRLSQSQIDTHLTVLHPEAVYSLSPMQAGLLFQALYVPNSDAYFVQTLLELTGELQIHLLKQALSKLLERHENLRASFMWEGLEEPVQIIHRQASLTWHEEEWSNLSTKEQTQQLNAYIAQDRAQGFNFNQAPLMRWSLFKFSNHKHCLIWSYHHILSDGWSVPIILNEVKSIYDSLVQGQVINLPPRRPYRDYIAWLSRQDQKKGENYWRRALAGVTPTMLSSGTIKEDQTAFEEYMLAFNEEMSQRLLSYAAELGITVNTVLQALWGIVLSVYTGRSDVVFGVVVSGRQINLPGIEQMVGMFINTLPLRVQVRGDESLEKVFRNTQDQMVGMQEHAYVPLWKIQAQQKEGGSGLFDSTYVYQNYPIQNDTDQPAGLGVKLARGIEKAEYTLGITLSYEDCLSARIHYRKACFTQDFIEQMLKDFEQLILIAIRNPFQKTGELSFLRPEVLKKLTVWNETQHAYSSYRSIHELFEAAVQRVPDTIAVVYKNQQISYNALNVRANQFANYLRGIGVEAEVPVALVIERSIEMVIGILGILKAGGTYVPMDVNYPPERLEYMLEDSGVPFIVSRKAELERLSAGQRIVIDLDEIKESLEEQPKIAPKQTLSSENLAYIIYTSGSTGRPKGVGISHGSVVHLALAQQEAFFYKPDTKTLQFASISFDASVSEWSCTFATGSTLILCDNKDITEVEETIAKQQINQMTMPPSILKEMSSEIISKYSRHLVVAGESPDLNLIKRYQEKNTKVINAYGPTEGTICASTGVISSTNHIGRPIWNTQMYLLDRYLNPVPIGVAGEIYIGGIGLARGYLNKPDLTAERFIPNPFGSGSRLYKTGDLGKYLPEGNIEFLGRIDHQVKLRGFRIELGEIEGTIEDSKAVQQAVVLCREDMPGHKRLVAYVIPKNKENNGEDDGLIISLQSLCQSRLPDYMQPSQWVVLESLPLTANGKLDRIALKDREDKFNIKESILPRNSIECALGEIFKKLLNIDPIGLNNNFFEIGGDSLLAVSLVLNIKKELGVKIRVIDIFENPTVCTLATVIFSYRSSELNPTLDNQDPIFIIQPDGKQKPLFLIHPGVGLSLPYLPLKSCIQDRPIIGIDDPYIGEEVSGFKNIEEMASAYIKIIKKIQETGPYYLAGWSFGGMVAFEMTRQMEESLDTVDALILIEAANPALVENMIFKDQNTQQEFEQQVDRNVLLSRTLRPKYVKAKVSLIKAQLAFSELTPESHKLFQDSKYGWDKYCIDIKEYTIPGEHATIFDKENITQIGNTLRDLLKQGTKDV